MSAESGAVIWSESYDRPFADRVRLQEDVANQVIRKLQTTILGKRRTTNL